MYLIPIWCTLSSFMLFACLGRSLGSRGTYVYAMSSMSLSVTAAAYIFYEVCLCQSVCHVSCFDWFAVGIVNVKWGLVFDQLSSTMLLVITSVSVCAQAFSIEYMREDPHSIRFFAYLSLFTFFMIFLVTSDNMLQLFMGWEGVGICSYLLINFWATRLQANKAAILAVVTNKVGDIALLLCCAALFHKFGTSDFTVMFSCIEASHTHVPTILELSYVACIFDSAQSLAYPGAYIDAETAYGCAMSTVCILLLVGGVGKSAQAGLHIWLPEAMEGPTPVSSLIHAATMVTAGIFLLVRCSVFFHGLDSVTVYVVLIGSITAFFSSTIGLLQTDVKKVVAYSTCSQLGYMFVCCGFSAYNNSMYHLFNHAFFKALLFLTAGYIIHALGNEQDIRRMGSLLRILPLPYVLMSIGSLSLIGLPSLSGFYSKDKIIELCFSHYIHTYEALWMYKYVSLSQTLCMFAVVFTILYSIKLTYYIFYKRFAGISRSISNIHFSALCTQIPLLCLSILSISSGYITNDMMVGVGSDFWGKAIHTDTWLRVDDASLYKSGYILHTEYNQYIRQIALVWTLYFSFWFTVTLVYMGDAYYDLYAGSTMWGRRLLSMVNRKYLFINRIIVVISTRTILVRAYSIVYRLFDKGFIEFIGPFGVVSLVRSAITHQYRLQSGLVYHYAGLILLTLIFMLHVSMEVVGA